jgi:hypothetical protein
MSIRIWRGVVKYFDESFDEIIYHPERAGCWFNGANVSDWYELLKNQNTKERTLDYIIPLNTRNSHQLHINSSCISLRTNSMSIIKAGWSKLHNKLISYIARIIQHTSIKSVGKVQRFFEVKTGRTYLYNILQ